MTARGAADFLTRSTAILGGMFIVLSIVMAAIAGATREPTKIDTSLANTDDAARSRRGAGQQPAPKPQTAPEQNQQAPGRPAGAVSADAIAHSFFRSGRLRQRRSTPLSLESHGAVHFRHRRRGLIAWKRSSFRVPRGAPPGARVQGPDPQVRSLSERRSGDDVAVPARRSLCDRRRGRDRPRPRPLRALHRSLLAPVGQCHDRPHLPRHHRQGAARRLSRRDRPGHPARHQRDQGIRARRDRRAAIS